MCQITKHGLKWRGWVVDRTKRPEGALLLQKACLFTADEAHQSKLYSFMDDPLDVIPVARHIAADLSSISAGEMVMSVELFPTLTVTTSVIWPHNMFNCHLQVSVALTMSHQQSRNLPQSSIMKAALVDVCYPVGECFPLIGL